MRWTLNAQAAFTVLALLNCVMRSDHCLRVDEDRFEFNEGSRESEKKNENWRLEASSGCGWVPHRRLQDAFEGLFWVSEVLSANF
ncbi:hypothetical protein L596_012278 [Steinernema carpocapsae]|uniref:Secreted protein n=1 Tax=Steinernema carpocapsae TaxID=34508 RepID=A0A4V6A4R1_STECR|nr:hypothetical protein L596_012278 [Steinernema carpocapsae]